MDSGDRLLATMLAGVGLAGFAFALGFYPRPEPEPVEPAKISVEEARYMLECTQDWGLSGDECRAVLHGKNPPQYDGYGC
ncbi:unnamed protein product [marine sediment metagenome]|uniref:Uncharacterized protein n=1 Tax=marine sediment metagenome TaxID=412755 RepID=X0XGA5_9ZZZZ